MDQRMSKDKYYLNIADAVLDRSTCLRRKYGAIIVKNDEILSTGYNGAPRRQRRAAARHDLVRHVPAHDHQLRHHARRQPHRRRRH